MRCILGRLTVMLTLAPLCYDEPIETNLDGGPVGHGQIQLTPNGRALQNSRRGAEFAVDTCVSFSGPIFERRSDC